MNESIIDFLCNKCHILMFASSFLLHPQLPSLLHFQLLLHALYLPLSCIHYPTSRVPLIHCFIFFFFPLLSSSFFFFLLSFFLFLLHFVFDNTSYIGKTYRIFINTPGEQLLGDGQEPDVILSYSPLQVFSLFLIHPTTTGGLGLKTHKRGQPTPPQPSFLPSFIHPTTSSFCISLYISLSPVLTTS